MPKVYTTDGIILAKVMRDHLNGWPNKPTEIKLEDLGKTVPSMMLQQLSAAEKLKQYVNGSYIGVWNFAVYIRIAGDDTASRLDAVACLSDLGKWLTEQNDRGNYKRLPNIDGDRVATSIRMTASPSIAVRYENNVEDYQALFALEYKYSRRI